MLRLAVDARELVPAPQPRLVVVQALPKGERAELAVEVMTELGVDEIVPWAASRSIAQWHGPRGEKALERWRRTAREAAKQSRRPRFPVIGELASTADVAPAGRAGGGGPGAARGRRAQPLAAVAAAARRRRRRGRRARGRDRAGRAGRVRRGRRGWPCAWAPAVLRTSTAGAAALAALSVRLGRWA